MFQARRCSSVMLFCICTAALALITSFLLFMVSPFTRQTCMHSIMEKPPQSNHITGAFQETFGFSRLPIQAHLDEKSSLFNVPINGGFPYTYCISRRNFCGGKQLCGIIGVKSSTALRMNSRCTWRHREDSRNVDNTAIRRALSPLRPCGSVTADVHGCPRGVVPLRHPLAIRGNPVAHTEGETTQSPHHSTGCAARPSLLFSPPGNGFSTLAARWKLLI